MYSAQIELWMSWRIKWKIDCPDICAVRVYSMCFCWVRRGRFIYSTPYTQWDILLKIIIIHNPLWKVGGMFWVAFCAILLFLLFAKSSSVSFALSFSFHCYSSLIILVLGCQRGTECLAQEHNTVTWPGLKPIPFDPEFSMLTIRPSHLPLTYQMWILFHFTDGQPFGLELLNIVHLGLENFPHPCKG